MADDQREIVIGEEAAFLRHVTFGELPARVLPDDRAGSVALAGGRIRQA